MNAGYLYFLLYRIMRSAMVKMKKNRILKIWSLDCLIIYNNSK